MPAVFLSLSSLVDRPVLTPRGQAHCDLYWNHSHIPWDDPARVVEQAIPSGRGRCQAPAMYGECDVSIRRGRAETVAVGLAVTDGFR